MGKIIFGEGYCGDYVRAKTMGGVITLRDFPQRNFVCLLIGLAMIGYYIVVFTVN